MVNYSVIEMCRSEFIHAVGNEKCLQTIQPSGIYAVGRDRIHLHESLCRMIYTLAFSKDTKLEAN